MNAEVATRLPTSVVAQDHKLETANENSSLELMKLRWHWTLNEANAQRVSVADYAQQVGRKPRVIYTYATGYTFVLVDKHLGVDDARSKASMTAETAAAHEAVVKHYGGSIQSTSRRTHRGVAHRIRDTARTTTSTSSTVPQSTKFLPRLSGGRPGSTPAEAQLLTARDGWSAEWRTPRVAARGGWPATTAQAGTEDCPWRRSRSSIGRGKVPTPS